MLAFLQSGWFWYPLICIAFIVGILYAIKGIEEDQGWDGWNDIDEMQATLDQIEEDGYH